jgi:hypothetical protein
MIQTYVFGTPYGFNYFEYDKDPQYDAYFKSFYISTRKGSRMMINRNHNGDTIYTFLRYDLIEVHNRPNSFFGMSVVLSDHQYSDDPKNVFKFFEYLFETVCKRGKIFQSTANGKVQYSVEKFSDVTAEIEWLKRNLPNIFSKDADANILTYDEDFKLGNTGQIACLSDQETNECILNVLKKYHWVCLSSEFKEIQESLQGESVSPEYIELSYTELDSKYNEINEKLVQFAYGDKKNSSDLIKNADSDVQDITSNIIKFISNLDDSEEKSSFKELLKKYELLASMISSALKSTPSIVREQNTQYCFACKQYKPLSEFSSKDATKCIACERKSPPIKTRLCTKCHKQKPLSEFTNDSSICKSCNSNRVIDWDKIFTPKLYASLFTVLIIALGCWFFLGGHKEEVSHDDSEVAVEESPLDESFSEDTFRQYLEQKDFDNALQYIKDSTPNNFELYFSQIKRGVEDEVLAEIEQSDINQIKDNVTKYFIEHKSYIDNGLIDKEYWESFASDYVTLMNLSTRNNLSENDVRKCKAILSKYPEDNTISDLAQSIVNRYNASLSLAQSRELKAKVTSTSVTITNFDKQNQQIGDPLQTNKSGIYNFTVGSFVVIQVNSDEKIEFKNGPFSHSRKNNSVKIELKTVGSNSYTIGGIKITINAEQKKPQIF